MTYKYYGDDAIGSVLSSSSCSSSSSLSVCTTRNLDPGTRITSPLFNCVPSGHVAVVNCPIFFLGLGSPCERIAIPSTGHVVFGTSGEDGGEDGSKGELGVRDLFVLFVFTGVSKGCDNGSRAGDGERQCVGWLELCFASFFSSRSFLCCRPLSLYRLSDFRNPVSLSIYSPLIVLFIFCSLRLLLFFRSMVFARTSTSHEGKKRS
jgi:hypothetical protein